MANLIHSNQILYPLSGSFSGSLYGTASNAVSSSYATTASYIIGGGSGGVLQYSSSALFPGTGVPTILYVDQSTKLSYYYSGSGYIGVGTFNNDITVNLSGGKTLGKYTTGQTIPAKGLTAEQMFNLVAQEAINPTVTLNSPTTILYNQSSTTNILTGSYTINSLGATIVSASLYWNYNGEVYTLLTSSTANPLYYIHSLTLGAYNATSSINYLYAVTESSPASSSAVKAITIGGYNNPGASFTAFSLVNSITGESTYVRDYGNMSSSLSATVTNNNTLVPLTSYTLQRIDTNGTTAITSSNNPVTGTIFSGYTDKSAGTNDSSLYYRILVSDGHQSNYTAATSTTVNFYYRNYLAASSTVVNSNATAQTVVNAAFSSSLSTTRAWTPICISATDILGNYTYIVYPSSYGNLSNIIQNGALSVLTAFTNLGTYSVTNSYGVSVSVLVYKSNSDKAFASGTTLAII
jgi:hypothetical protein